MNVRRFAYVLALFAAGSVAAHAECAYPKSPGAAPNGSAATKDEMVAYMQVFKKYQADMDAYLGCIDSEADQRAAAAGDKQDQVKQIKEMASKKHNAAVDEVTKRADEFNQQVRAFNNKAKG